MGLFKLGKSRLFFLVLALQLALLLIYLNDNIVNVGEMMGTGLSFLAFYIFFFVIVVFSLLLNRRIYLRFHFFIFMLLIFWISYRTINDLGDMEYLKQITIATTGGMLFFYILGASIRVCYCDSYTNKGDVFLSKVALIVFFMLQLWMLYKFSFRLRSDIFYLVGVNGLYQRAGNFLSISFIIVSFYYLQLMLNRVNKYISISLFFWLVIYTVSTLIALVGSQMFGSNSATGVILGIYVVTLMMTLIISQKSLWINYINGRLALPFSKEIIIKMCFMALIAFVFLMIILVLVIVISGFNVNSLRLVGFGLDTNTSLLSRIKILLDLGETQLSYAPFFGNMNVAYLTVGDAGLFLHSFFPYVMANLGIVGLWCTLVLFISLLLQLYREGKSGETIGLYDFQISIVAIYSFLIFFYILFFANMTTSISWPVLWFTFGFISKPLGFK
nr:O-antigen polysaccharide polymerase Wzy [Plesiomonas shigelloides]